MSRSFKKCAVVRDHDGRRVSHRYRTKTMANRAVRREKDRLDGGGFKKVYESWNICDWKSYMTEEEFNKNRADGNTWLRRDFKTYKEAYRWWYTSFKRK